MTSTSAADLVQRLAAAEEAGDLTALSELIADDFALVGPLGFMLEKKQWLEQWRDGNLRFTRVVIGETRARTYGDVAIVVGVQEQAGEYRGRAVDGRFRITLVVRTTEARAQVVGAHLSDHRAGGGDLMTVATSAAPSARRESRANNGRSRL